MAKVVISRLRATRGTRGSATRVTTKRFRDASGKSLAIRKLDAGSQTFGEDLQYSFERNVAKARRDNKLQTGSADIDVDA